MPHRWGTPGPSGDCYGREGAPCSALTPAPCARYRPAAQLITVYTRAAEPSDLPVAVAVPAGPMIAAPLRPRVAHAVFPEPAQRFGVQLALPPVLPREAEMVARATG